MKYRKKPVVIEAVQWDGDNLDEVVALGGVDTSIGTPQAHQLAILTPEGTMFGSKGDWIIRGVKGEFYPCKPDIFEMTYEPVEEEV